MSGGPVIHFPSDAEVEASKAKFLAALKALMQERHAAALAALPCLKRLVAAMRGGSGQSYKLRKLLYSLWAGVPTADLSDVNGLDWQLRKDFCAFLMGWGYEDREVKVFYDALSAELMSAGLFDWFREEGDE